MQITFNLKWISGRLLVIAVIFTSLFTASCRNMFSELADQESDAALYYSAKQLINTGDYTEAIDIIENEIDPGYAARRDVMVTLASAYVGRCGLDYVQLAKSFISNPTNATPMELALVHMKASTNEDDCVEAENIMRTVSPAGDGILSDNDNDAFLMAFISIAKLGAILERLGDTDNDGVINGGFDACTLLPANANEARELGSAMTLIYNNLVNSGSSIANKLASLDDVCSDPAVQAAGTCDKTDPATFTDPAELKMFLGAVNYSGLGVGSDVAYTACP